MEIYKLVLRTDIPVNINSSCAVKHITAMKEVGHGWITRQIDQNCFKKLGVIPAIILLNRQTHEEAIVVLYSTAQFIVANDLMEPALSIESSVMSVSDSLYAATPTLKTGRGFFTRCLGTGLIGQHWICCRYLSLIQETISCPLLPSILAICPLSLRLCEPPSG